MSIRQRSKSELRQGYSRGVRNFEIASIVVYAGVMAWLASNFLPLVPQMPWLGAAALMCGYVAADFVSGFVHWAADTWGTPEWPVVGKALIRPFREHHVDQKEITRHDFIETNGNNCFISIVPGVLGALLPQAPGNALNFFAAVFVFSLILWVLCTNQFHKWSHLDAPPKWIDVLQRWHLILPRDHHAQHHTAPYNKHYCITVGWLNEPLLRLGFFPFLERVVTATTGLLPREDDIGKQAALQVAAEQELESAAADALAKQSE